MKVDSQTVAIVTGGASGLGRAAAEALAAAGAKVAIFDINEEVGREFARTIGGHFCPVDILSEESVVRGFADARATQGQERVLVHCAMANRKGKTVGRNRETGELTRFSTEDFEFAMQGILVASYRLASHAAFGMASLDPLEDGERGSIVLTSSVAAEDGQVGQVAYGAGKSGVNGLVLPMARDLMDVGIRVNAIMPGIFATPLLGRLPEKVLTNLSDSVPFPKRLGRPEEFASLVLELVRNSYFNGQSMRLDGAIRMAAR